DHLRPGRGAGRAHERAGAQGDRGSRRAVRRGGDDGRRVHPTPGDGAARDARGAAPAGRGRREPGEALSSPTTPAAVPAPQVPAMPVVEMPLMICRWKNRNTTISGSAASTAWAMFCAYWMP